MPRPSLFLPLLLLLAACGDTRSDAQPAVPSLTTTDELAERMRARFEEAVGGVDGFTVLAGGYAITYTVQPDSVAPEQRIQVAMTATDSVAADPMVQGVVGSHVANVPLLAASLTGQPLSPPVERDGRRVYAIEAAGAAGVDSSNTGLRVFVDAATFDVREVYRSVRVDSLARPVTMRLVYDDFQTTDGVTLPWRIHMIQDGLDQLVDERTKMVQGGQLTLSREQLRRQPPSPARDAQLADVESQLRMITEGVQEAEVRVRRVTVAGSR